MEIIIMVIRAAIAFPELSTNGKTNDSRIIAVIIIVCITL
jgi:hypothetical protein